MILTLKFNLDDEDDRHSYKQALAGSKMASLLWSVEQELLRPARKHGYSDPKMHELLEKIPDGLGEELIGRLEELYYALKSDYEITEEDLT